VVQALVLACLALPAPAAPRIEHWETAEGARVYFVESRALPMLDVSVEFPAGSSRDTPQTSGLAALTLRMLRAGAGAMSEDQIAERLADTGAQLATRLDYDRAGYTLRTLSAEARRDPALALLACVLQQPAFPADALDREKARVIAGLREAQIKPDVIGAREFARLIYRDHPYALRPSGEPQTVEQLTREDLRRFHAEHYVASRAVIAIVGDVDRTQAERIAQRLTGGLSRAAAPLPPLPALPPLSAGAARDIAHASAQAHLILGAPGVARIDPDYFPLLVGNYILGGGGFNSRLSEQVRQKRGLAYSVHSQLTPYEERGVFSIGLQTRKDQAADALRAVRETYAAFVAQGPTPEELEGAKQHLIGAFPLRLDSNREIVEFLAVIGYYDLPLDWLERFPQRVAAVGADQIRDAFQRRIAPAQLAVVVVGGAGATTESAAQP
jgi:zinc protease